MGEERTATRSQAMLLDFLRDHEAACPVCGYNLKALTRPVCPECGQDLMLTVGAARVRLGWLMVAVAPGFFSGIAAAFLLIPIIGRLTLGDGRTSPALNALDLFGWTSGSVAITLAAKRHRFLALPRSSQRAWAIGIWFVHAFALVMFVVIGSKYL